MFLNYSGSLPGDTLYSRDSGSALSLGSVGTRRTVYLAEEQERSQPSPTPKPPSSMPPLLVYNRISTVIGEQQQPQPAEEPEPPNERKREGRKDNEVWYEYGCV